MVKTIIKYVGTLILGILLLWYFLKQQKTEDLEQAKQAFLTANYFWIFLTIVVSLFEKVIRAQRWNLLMEPLGNKPALKKTFSAVMVGYLANIFAPRMGEVARCWLLNRTDKVPVNASFGTVVTERIIDFACLLVCVAISLLIEYKKIMDLLSAIVSGKLQSLQTLLLTNYWLLTGVVFVFVLILMLLYKQRERIGRTAFVVKLRTFGSGLVQGILSIRKIRHKAQFFILTITIWVCYFLMTYLAFLSLPSTAQLGLGAGLVILVVGGLGMSAPVQAGIGAFHFFVSQALAEVYKVDEGGALSYAFLVHTSQTLMALIVGVICLTIVFTLTKKAALNIQNANV